MSTKRWNLPTSKKNENSLLLVGLSGASLSMCSTAEFGYRVRKCRGFQRAGKEHPGLNSGTASYVGSFGWVGSEASKFHRTHALSLVTCATQSRSNHANMIFESLKLTGHSCMLFVQGARVME